MFGRAIGKRRLGHFLLDALQSKGNMGRFVYSHNCVLLRKSHLLKIKREKGNYWKYRKKDA